MRTNLICFRKNLDHQVATTKPLRILAKLELPFIITQSVVFNYVFSLLLSKLIVFMLNAKKWYIKETVE